MTQENAENVAFNAKENTGVLLDLANRCERSAIADRELDDAIATAIFRYSGMSQIVGVPEEQQFRTFTYANGSIGSSLRYTASLDAAMTLVPKDHVKTVGDWYNGDDGRPPFFADCGPHNGDEFGDIQQAWAASEPLALVAASLRARAAVEEG